MATDIDRAALAEAKEEILKRTKSHYKKRKLSELTKTEKEIIEQVLKNCSDYFQSISVVLSKNALPFAWPNPERDAELLNCLERDYPSLAKQMKRKNKEAEHISNKTVSTSEPAQLSKLFVQFETKYLQQVLAPTSSIIRILPYLLASYYIKTCNFPAKGYPSYFDLFDIQLIEASSNCNRMAGDFVKLFTLEDLIPKFISKKNTDKSRDVQKINSIEDYKDFLGQEHIRKISNGKFAYCVEKHQYEAIFQVFAYSLCVVACMNVPQLSEQIDYKQSFDLFQKHTSAFSTVFIVYECGDASGTLFYTIEEFLKIISPAKARRHIKKSEYRDIYKQCGIGATSISVPVEEYSQEWYKNAAIQLVYELHPCEYLGWWNDNDTGLPLKKISDFQDYIVKI